MNNSNFFDAAEDQSIVKARIIEKYFWAWAKVIIPTAKLSGGKVAYIDLFAGPGRYKDGTKSTPLLILEKAVQDEDLKNMLVTIFNDGDKDFTQSLAKEIQQIPNIDTLRYKPKIQNTEIGEEIARMFQQTKLIPTLFFVDPWGYKGLSLDLINAVLKDWGSDCIFFFNYNRISMGLPNQFVRDHMESLFGRSKVNQINQRLQNLSPYQRELAIVEEISLALKDRGKRYVLPFRFRNKDNKRTSHHLIFISKHFRGYEIMKGVMAAESSTAIDGVASFEYNPATANQQFLAGLMQPIADLENTLLKHFSGRTLTMKDIYLEHNIDTPFISSNYKDALKRLEAAGKVITDPPAHRRKKNTFADAVMVTFP